MYPTQYLVSRKERCPLGREVSRHCNYVKLKELASALFKNADVSLIYEQILKRCPKHSISTKATRVSRGEALY